MFRISLILLFFIIFYVFAHQPKLINYSPSKDNPYEVINPVLFASGFATGTATLHLFGVGIGYFFTQSTISSTLLRVAGVACSLYGCYLLSLI